MIFTTDSGRLLGIEKSSGSTRWELQLPGPLWGSPVVVDDVRVQGDCIGNLWAYALTDGAGNARSSPELLWTVKLGGCIESTPMVYGGRIYVGT